MSLNQLQPQLAVGYEDGGTGLCRLRDRFAWVQGRVCMGGGMGLHGQKDGAALAAGRAVPAGGHVCVCMCGPGW